MLRKFEEIGATIGGVKIGLFDGEAEFDHTGHVVTIELEAHDGPPLRLSIAELVRERVALRHDYGVDFAELAGQRGAAHAQKWYLFVALSVSLLAAFKDDIIDHLADVEDSRKQA